MANRKLDGAFDKPKRNADEAEEFISAAEVEANKKPAYTQSGKEAVSARKMCLSLSVREEDAIDKLSVVQRKSKAAIVREAIDLYIKRNAKDIERYDAFFGN